MKIADVRATNLDIPYRVPYRPAWQPGLVRMSREVTLVVVRTEDGIVGYAAADGHHAGNVARNVAPYLVGQDAWATERHARTFRNAGGTWFIDQALWDIVGKAAGLPLYKLWGAIRDRVPAYASTAELGSPENRAALAQRYRAEGFRAMKLRFHHEELGDDLALLDALSKNGSETRPRRMGGEHQSVAFPCRTIAAAERRVKGDRRFAESAFPKARRPDSRRTGPTRAVPVAGARAGDAVRGGMIFSACGLSITSATASAARGATLRDR
jgi:hypothetical protein